MVFETMCISNLLFNKPYLTKVLPYIKEEYFELEGDRVMFSLIKEYSAKYNAAPTLDALKILVDDSEVPEQTYDECAEIMTQFKFDPEVSLDWLVDESEKWARDRALFNALHTSISIVNGDARDMTKGIIPDLLTDALGVNFDTDLGHDYDNDAGVHYDTIHNDEFKTPFAIDILNKATAGGVPNKTLNIIMAGINTGKTTWLIDQACHWRRLGKNVVYFTLEVSEDQIRHRADTNMLDMAFSNILALTKHQFVHRIDCAMKKYPAGRLIIKEYPSGVGHAGHFKTFLNELKLKKHIVPDVIIVDYLGECASAVLPDSVRGNTNTYLTGVSRELRALGNVFDVPVWTAAQFTRTGQTATDVDMTDTGDAIGIQKVADFVLALVQTPELESRNQVIAKVLKNRYANKSKLKKFTIGLNNDLQKLFNVSNLDQSGVMTEKEMNYAGEIKGPGVGHSSTMADWTF